MESQNDDGSLVFETIRNTNEITFEIGTSI